tara:strand:- start:577 stop:900 length:324 start_codon:yes stop_codon:yes gene_type:complete
MSAYGSYQNAYRRASVNTMDQGKLIVMLYDGAIRNINFALQHLKDDEVEKTHNCLVKAKNIVTELLSTLNMNRGVRLRRTCRASTATCSTNSWSRMCARIPSRRNLC